MSDDELARRIAHGERLRAHGPRAEAAARPGAQGATARSSAMTGDGVNDAPALRGRRHRHRDGRARHRRRARVRRARASPTTTSPRSSAASARAAASSTTCARRWRTSSPSTCRSSGCRCIPVFVAGLAAGAAAGADRVPRAHHRPGLLDRLRGRADRPEDHGPTTARARRADVRPAGAHDRRPAGRCRCSPPCSASTCGACSTTDPTTSSARSPSRRSSSATSRSSS